MQSKTFQKNINLMQQQSNAMCLHPTCLTLRTL